MSSKEGDVKSRLVKERDKRIDTAWDNYFASVPGTPEAVEALRVVAGIHGSKEEKSNRTPSI